MAVKNTEDWLSPMNKMIWMKAFKAKETKVVLRDGRKFTVNYNKRPGEIYVKSDHGYVPRGYFDAKKVMHTQWILETTS